MVQHRISIGLIGCGEHAREVILPTLLSTPYVSVNVLCDNDSGRIASCSAINPHARTTTDFRAVCSDSSIDAIVVVATPEIHSAAATLAIEAGKHVFVEKPFTADAVLAGRLASLAEASDVVSMVGHNLRFAPAFERVKNIMGDQAFGGPAMLEIRYLASKPRGDRWGLNSPERSFLLSHGSHALDIAVDLLGDDLRVTHAVMEREGDKLFAIIVLTASGGKVCTLTMTNGAPHFDIGVTVIGKNDGMIQMQSLRDVRNFDDPEHFKRVGHIWVPSTLMSGFGLAGYAGEFNAFIDSIQAGGKVVPSFADGARVIELIHQVLELSSVV